MFFFTEFYFILFVLDTDYDLLSCSPDATTNSEKTKLNIHDFFNQIYIFCYSCDEYDGGMIIILLTKTNHQFRIFTNFLIKYIFV